MKANMYYNTDEFEVNDTVTCTVYATAYYSYTPGTMYKRNGDPGDPPEEDFEVLDVDLSDFRSINENGDDWEFEPTPGQMEIFKDQVTEWLEHHSEVFNVDENPYEE